MELVRIPLAQLRDHLARCKQRDPRTKVALVLSASAAPAAYQAGVLDALRRQGVPFDLVVGSSGGALNAVLQILDALEPPGDESTAVRVWRGMCLERVLAPALVVRAWQRLSSLSLPLGLAWAGRLLVLPCKLVAFLLAICRVRLSGSLFSSRPLYQTILDTLYAGLHQEGPGRRSEAWIGTALGRRWQEAQGPELVLVTTDLNALAPVLFTLAGQGTVAALRSARRNVIALATAPSASDDRPGLLVPALMASSALYPFLPLQQVEGYLLGDGGYCGATPLDVALDAGATHVLVVRVETPANVDWLNRWSVWSLLKRIAATMVVSRGGRRDQRAQIFDIAPAAKLLSFLEFDGAYAGGRMVIPVDWLIGNGRRDAEAGFWLWKGGES